MKGKGVGQEGKGRSKVRGLEGDWRRKGWGSMIGKGVGR